MVLEVVYIIRHGYRSNWVVNSATGEYRHSFPTPTGIPTDPALASHGVTQASELAERISELDPPVDRWYSSPYYRCLQTVRPAVELARKTGGVNGKKGEEVRLESGVGEWHGLAPFAHPSPASLDVLQPLFPDLISPSYANYITPCTNGESISTLHDRVASALEHIITDMDDEKSPRAVLICSHAAPIIAMGRVLTGRMPEDIAEEDFGCWTCALSMFVRKRRDDISVSSNEQTKKEGWWKGRGVSGGWECVVNGDTSFLSGGAERGWHFSGDESFLSHNEAEKEIQEGGKTIIEGESVEQGKVSKL